MALFGQSRGPCTDYVNTAARLAVAAAKQKEPILCSERVADVTRRKVAGLASHKLVLRPAGSIRLKGKQEEVKVFRPEELTEQNGGGRPPPVRVVGRDVELELMRQAVSDSRAEGMRLMMVEGELGMGKSAMVDQLTHEFRDQPAGQEHGRRWMLLRGEEASGGAAFAACDVFLRWWLLLCGTPAGHTNVSCLLVRRVCVLWSAPGNVIDVHSAHLLSVMQASEVFPINRS